MKRRQRPKYEEHGPPMTPQELDRRQGWLLLYLFIWFLPGLPYLILALNKVPGYEQVPLIPAICAGIGFVWFFYKLWKLEKVEWMRGRNKNNKLNQW